MTTPETRHYHGAVLHDHPHTGPHRHGSSPWTPVLIILGVLVVCWGGWHVLSNEQAKSTPPAACQLFGGHWSIWSGWSCD